MWSCEYLMSWRWHQINDGLESSHHFSSDQSTQYLILFGSYFGLALHKDMAVIKCYIQQKLPRTFNDLNTHFKTIQIESPVMEEQDQVNCYGCTVSVGLVKAAVSRPMSLLARFAPSYPPLIRSVSDLSSKIFSYSSYLLPPLPLLTDACSSSVSNECWIQSINSVQSQVSLVNISYLCWSQQQQSYSVLGSH